MDATFVGLIGAIVTASIAALGGYFSAIRKMSGRIASSEAAELWQESAAIREDYRDRIAASERRTAILEQRVAELEKQNNELARINNDLAAKTVRFESTIATLIARAKRLEKDKISLEATIADLRRTGQP